MIFSHSILQTEFQEVSIVRASPAFIALQRILFKRERIEVQVVNCESNFLNKIGLRIIECYFNAFMIQKGSTSLLAKHNESRSIEWLSFEDFGFHSGVNLLS